MKLKSILQAVDVNKLQFIRKHLLCYLTFVVLVFQTLSCSTFSSGVVKSLLTLGTKESFCISKRSNSFRIGLEHEYGGRGVM